MNDTLIRGLDRVFELISPTRAATAAGCSEIRSYCDGDCPFWWWRRVHVIACNNGTSYWEYLEYEACGHGC